MSGGGDWGETETWEQKGWHYDQAGMEVAGVSYQNSQCWRCGAWGHLARDCPSKCKGKEEKGGKGVTCWGKGKGYQKGSEQAGKEEMKARAREKEKRCKEHDGTVGRQDTGRVSEGRGRQQELRQEKRDMREKEKQSQRN